jgi:hypothetical protein
MDWSPLVAIGRHWSPVSAFFVLSLYFNQVQPTSSQAHFSFLWSPFIREKWVWGI